MASFPEEEDKAGSEEFGGRGMDLEQGLSLPCAALSCTHGHQCLCPTGATPALGRGAKSSSSLWRHSGIYLQRLWLFQS